MIRMETTLGQRKHDALIVFLTAPLWLAQQRDALRASRNSAAFDRCQRAATSTTAATHARAACGGGVARSEDHPDARSWRRESVRRCARSRIRRARSEPRSLVRARARGASCCGATAKARCCRPTSQPVAAALNTAALNEPNTLTCEGQPFHNRFTNEEAASRRPLFPLVSWR